MPDRIPPGAAVVTAAQMRAAEDATFARDVTAEQLMERAGMAVAREVRRHAMGDPVLVLAGPGNNGGDAYVVARQLAEWGLDVEVASLGDARAGAAAAMAARWSGPTIALADASPRPVLVDGLFGTGVSRPLDAGVRGKLAELIDGARFTVAIDLPSGVDSDSGDVLDSPARADVTVAFAALKPAHVLFPASERCGQVRVVDIGVPVPDDCRVVAAPRLCVPAAAAHKFTRGMAVVVAGEMAGAARLAATAAARGGAGYTLLAGAAPDPAAPAAIVQREVSDAGALAGVLEDPRVTTVLIGPGLGRDAGARALLHAAIASPHRLVLDGDALSILGEAVVALDREAETVLTPHAGEFDRMFGSSGGDKIARTRAAASAARAIVVHKGADTVIADPKGDVRILSGASPWLATAGTGDVLAGLVAAAPGGLEGAAEAAWLHARAARLAGPAFIADDLARAIPSAIAECL